MKKLIAICVVAISVILAASMAAQAGLYTASASMDNTITVSGSWTVSHYKSDASYSATNCGSDFKSRAEGSSPIDLSTTYSCPNGSASSSVQVNAVPKVIISSDAEVHDVLMPSGHWAMGYSNGGANWLQSGQTGDITVTCDWSYALSLVQAENPSEAYAKIYVAFWGPSSDLLLTEKDGFVQSSPYLVKTIDLTSAGTSSSSSGSTSWTVSVTNGTYYSFWGQGDAMAYTTPEPATIALLGLGALSLLRRKR
jgi:hypothetical protein